MISNTLISGAWFLDGVRTLEERTAKTQREISSGFRVHDAADSPLEAASLVSLGTSLDSLQQYTRNLSRVKAEIATADSALTNAIQLTDRARTLAAQAAGSTVTPAERAGIAVEVKNIQQQLVSLANTSVEGRFIFGGDLDQTAPYQYDATAPRGVTAITGQAATRTFQSPSGIPVFTGETASNIFDPADSAGGALSGNVFAALQDFLTSLQANDLAGITAASDQIKAAGAWLNQKQAGYGGAENRINSETNAVSDLLTTLRSRISDIRDTDVVQAAIDLALENTAQSAAFSAQAAVSRKSLFDYLG